MSSSRKPNITLAVAIFMVLSASAATAQSPVHAPAQAKHSKHFVEAAAPSGAPLLFNQTGDPNFEGILAMTNLDSGQQAFDTELADDFDVPAGGWAVSIVRIGTFYHSFGTPVRPSITGNVTFYADSGSGQPGAAVPNCTHSNIPLYYNEAFLTSVMTLPTICALPAGRYWMGFSGNLSYDDQQGGVFVTQEVAMPYNSIVWRNPGGGYATGCTNWSTPTSCTLNTNGGMTFQLYGQTTPVSLQSFSVE